MLALAKTPLASANIDAPAACAVPFRPYCGGVVTRTRNVIEYMLVLALCLVVFVVVQAPIPAVVLSYRLSRSLRGWHPGHHELAGADTGSAADLSVSQEDQRQQQKQQKQQQQPDSEYGAIAKFAGMTTSHRYHRGYRERGF